MMGATGALWWLDLGRLDGIQPAGAADLPDLDCALVQPVRHGGPELKSRNRTHGALWHQSKGFFVMDGSKRSAHTNAYFTGFGASKRVVFYDTLLAQLSPAEVDAVLAHELGHFKHRHILKRIVAMFGMSLLGFAALGWLSQQVWFYTGLGVAPNMTGPNDALALLLFMMVLPLVGTSWALLHSCRASTNSKPMHAIANQRGRPIHTPYSSSTRTMPLTPDQCT